MERAVQERGAMTAPRIRPNNETRMRLAYVAGPYRAPDEWGVLTNIRNAESVALELWKLGFAVICPHKNTALFGGAAPDDVWLKGDLEMIRRCDLLVLIPGWEASSGSREEKRKAEEWGIPVREWPMCLRDENPKFFVVRG
jgi:hypothetical protein